MQYRNPFYRTIVVTAASLFLATSAAYAKTFKMALGDAQGGTQWKLGTTLPEKF